MIKNWLIYLGSLAALFAFSAYHGFETTTWNMFLLVMFTPVASLIISLPLMIWACAKGIGVKVPAQIRQGEPTEIKIMSNAKGRVIFPQLQFTLTCKNDFARSRKKYRRSLFFGSSKTPFTIINRNLSDHCGIVQMRLRRCMVCDFTGMFFIPMQFKSELRTTIMPKVEKPAFLPSSDQTQVLGYKPKPGGGFADDYELRPYRDGDSMKMVHWKVSSKHDELVVRDPSLPIHRDLIIRLDFTDKPDENDSIAARFMYAGSFLLDQKKVFSCYTVQNGGFPIENHDDLKRCLTQLYDNRSGNAVTDFTHADVYIIGARTEEVTGL